jgi:hypothetical protein
MTSHHDETATGWRDLADQLTDEQLLQLEIYERRPPSPRMADPAARLWLARSMARSNLIQHLHAEIPLPADAAGLDEVNNWQLWKGTYSRLYTAWSHIEDGLTVHVFGTQFADGRVERSITVEMPGPGMDARLARGCAAALLNAADLLDQFDGA